MTRKNELSEFPQLKIPAQILDALNRLTLLDALADREADMTELAVYDEMRKLRLPLVELFLPVVELLVRARLLEVYVDEVDTAREERTLRQKYASVGYDVTSAFQNGNIFLAASEPNMWTLRKRRPVRTNLNPEEDVVTE